MPIYMVQASYTSAAWNKLVQRPENRMEANGPGPTRQGITAQRMRRGYEVSRNRILGSADEAPVSFAREPTREISRFSRSP